MVPKTRPASGPLSSPFSAQVDEDEKTTIESGWEDEPSTTVEQGEVADRIRALGVEPRRQNFTNVTSTNAGMLDEPTVDDQHANAALSILTPPAIQGRLVVTAGNDNGQELSVLPGKSYTIGRAVDNDFVLSDIAVSRKHFDLRFEGGAWVIADRGSGNGTVVNGAVEDHPFMLANGDTIEIGNTQFRFELPNGAPRPQPSYASMEAPLDEEEPSTVAGKIPVRNELEIHTPSSIPTPVAMRAKTVPPPMPPRSRAPSVAPPFPPPQPLMPPPQPPSASQSMPGATNPVMPANAGMPMHNGLHLNGMHNGLARGPVAPTMLGDSMGLPQPPPPSMVSNTLPGPGAPMPPQPMYGYPDMHPGSQPLISGSHPMRDPTALVPPTPYNGLPVAQPYRQPALSRRMKMIVGGAALTLFAAIVTVSIIKGTSGGGATTNAAGKPADEPKDAGATPPKQEPKKTASVNDAIKGEAPKKDPAKVTVQPIDPPKKETPKAEATTTDTVAKVTVQPIETPKVETPKVETPRVETPKVETPRQETVAKKDPPKQEKDPPKKAPPKQETAAKKDPPKKEKTVATADTSAVREKAESQYRAKNFSGAASTLKSAASSFGPGEASDLRTLAAAYEKVGKLFNLGMAPGTPAKEAFNALWSAKSYDNTAGGAFGNDIESQLGKIAPKAAVSFMAAKDYASARRAVSLAESSGNKNATTDGVRSSLEQKAGELFRQAQSEMSSDPSGAKAKLKQVQAMVEPKSQWHQKAAKLLSGG